MIIEQFTNEAVSSGWLITPAVVSLFVAICCLVNSKHWHSILSIIGMVFLAVAMFLGIEMLNSASKIPETPVVRSISKIPVEHRSENNILYVFYNDTYVKASTFSEEFIKPNDTLYVYETVTIGGLIRWNVETHATFQPITQYTWEDSIEVIETPQRIPLKPEDLSTKPIESQTDSLLLYLENY